MTCHPNAGIYMIINKVTGQRYFGQAKDFDGRVKLDRLYISHGCHNKWLMADIQKYGWEGFDLVRLFVAGEIGDEDLQIWLNRHEKMCFDMSKAQGKWKGFHTHLADSDYNICELPQAFKEPSPFWVRCIDDGEDWQLCLNVNEYARNNGLKPPGNFARCGDPKTTSKTMKSKTTNKVYSCKRVDDVMYCERTKIRADSKSYVFVVKDNQTAFDLEYKVGDIIYGKSCHQIAEEFVCNANHLSDIAQFHNGTPNRNGFNKDGSPKYDTRKSDHGVTAYLASDFHNHYPNLRPGATNIYDTIDTVELDLAA